MGAKIDPQPAIKSLERAGWKYQRPLEHIHHDGHLMLSPSGYKRRVQFRGRRATSTASRQYVFGIFYKDFDAVDDMAFWAHDERVLLVVPTDYLEGLFDPEIAKVDDRDRWHVSIYFERYGHAELVPVYYQQSFQLDEYAVPFKAA